MSNLLQMPNRRPRQYRIAIHYDPERTTFTVAVGPGDNATPEVRERPSLSEVIADLQSLSVSKNLVSEIVRRFASETDIVIDDVPILDAGLWRFRKRRVK